MRVVLDTNVLLAGLLWLGVPHHILELADDGEVTLCTSNDLLEELEEVLRRAKFQSRLARRQTTVDELISSVVSATEIFETTKLNPIPELRDPDDILVFECAVAANAEYIVSGDKDLLVIGKFRAISIVAPAEFVENVENK